MVPLIVGVLMVDKVERVIYSDIKYIGYNKREVCNTMDMLNIMFAINSSIPEELKTFVLDVTSIRDLSTNTYLYKEMVDSEVMKV